MTQHKKILLTGASLTSGNKGINALTLGSIISLYNNNDNIDVEIFSQNYKLDEVILHNVNIGNRVIQIKEYHVWSSKFILCGLLHLVFGFLPKSMKNFLFIRCLKIYYFLTVIIQKRIVDFHETGIKRLINADIVINLSEGDSFSDIYGMHVFLRHSLDKVIAHSHGVPYCFFPQTLGPFDSAISRKLAGKIFRSAEKIYAREEQTRDYLLNIFGKLPNMEEANDMAFLMEPEPVLDSGFEQFCSHGIIVGINISGFLISEPLGRDRILGGSSNYSEITDRIITTLLSINKNIKIVFVSHVQGQDDKINKLYIEKYTDLGYGKRLFLLRDDYTAPQLKYFLSRLSFFTGARMHACIGALSTAVPTVPQAYSYKFIGITNKFGIGEYVIDLKNDSLDTVEQKIKYVFNNKNDIKRKVVKSFPEIKRDAEKCGKSV